MDGRCGIPFSITSNEKKNMKLFMGLCCTASIKGKLFWAKYTGKVCVNIVMLLYHITRKACVWTINTNDKGTKWDEKNSSAFTWQQYSLLIVSEQYSLQGNVIDYGKCVWLDESTRLTGFNSNSCLFGKELAELQHPLPTSDSYMVSAAISQNCKMHKWKVSAHVIKECSKQTYYNIWKHKELTAKLFIEQN